MINCESWCSVNGGACDRYINLEMEDAELGTVPECVECMPQKMVEV